MEYIVYSIKTINIDDDMFKANDILYNYSKRQLATATKNCILRT